MCQEVFKIVQNMDLTQVENKMALQCAPVIAGIKISNLLIVASCDEVAVRMILKKTGIIHYRLLRKDDKTTFLLFRKLQLATYLQEPDVQRILKVNGYEDLSLGGILKTFQRRYETCRSQGVSFPHEVGLLLGYPVEDVAGFIEHKGKQYLYAGYWKVYENIEKKKRLFEAYESAKEELILWVANGYSIPAVIEHFQKKDAARLQVLS